MTSIGEFTAVLYYFLQCKIEFSVIFVDIHFFFRTKVELCTDHFDNIRRLSCTIRTVESFYDVKIYGLAMDFFCSDDELPITMPQQQITVHAHVELYG